MVSNPSNNSSSLSIPFWMGHPWHMSTVSGNVVSYSHSPNVTFDTSNLTVALYGTTWGSLEPGSVAIAASSTAAMSTVRGITLSGQPFHIDHVDGMLKCYLDNPRQGNPWTSVALGTIAGTLLGGAAGLAAGSLLLGTVAGLIGATTGSLVTFRRLPQSGSGHHPPPTGGGSTPTWVANDGPSGRPGGQPGPHLVDGTTA